VLCECEERDQVYRIREVLKRVGVESWVQSRGWGLVYPRVLVAADELDRAQTIIANPIPQDIIDESHETAPEFEPPRCPSCGAEDSVLESAEPVNAWKCEICGREWSDPAGDSEAPGSLA
jgi:ribosomal protein S27E